MPACSRLTDISAGHCYESRASDSASSNVFINGLGAHRVGDHWPTHNCIGSSHDSTTIEGSPNVFVNGMPKARIGDPLSCGDIIAQGSPNVVTN